MTFESPILFFLCSLGVFNGILVSIYFLFFEKRKRTQNTLFGFLVLMLSIRIGKSVYSLFSESKDLLVMQIGLSACFLIGVFLFYYLKSSVENRKKTPVSWKFHIAILLITVVVVGFVKPYRTHVEFWRDFVMFIYGVWGFYLLMSVFVLKDVIGKLFIKTEKLTTSELWLIWVFVGNFLIYIAYIIGYFYLYLVGTITFSVVFYALLIFLLFKSNRVNVFKDIPEKYASKKIEDNDAHDLIELLNRVMNENQFHKNTNIKLNDIAKKLHISSHQLSQLLNDNLGKSFAFFISEFRINEAKQLLKEKNKFTIEAIGFEAGFSSKSTFYATFKKATGITPTEYKKQYS